MHISLFILTVYSCRISWMNFWLAINSPDNVACRANEVDFLKYYPLHHAKLHVCRYIIQNLVTLLILHLDYYMTREYISMKFFHIFFVTKAINLIQLLSNTNSHLLQTGYQFTQKHRIMCASVKHWLPPVMWTTRFFHYTGKIYKIAMGSKVTAAAKCANRQLRLLRFFIYFHRVNECTKSHVAKLVPRQMVLKLAYVIDECKSFEINVSLSCVCNPYDIIQ